MRILIIEDGQAFAQRMSEILTGLGEITVCTTDEKTGLMPTKHEVIQLIKDSDLVLLDNVLGAARYMGRDLLPECAGKKTIGISSMHDIGPVNFDRKLRLNSPDVAEEFRDLVARTLAS